MVHSRPTLGCFDLARARPHLPDLGLIHWLRPVESASSRIDGRRISALDVCPAIVSESSSYLDVTEHGRRCQDFLDSRVVCLGVRNISRDAIWNRLRGVQL